MKTNIFLATFTTCWARLKLHSVLDSLGDRVLYYDTDSVIFVSRPGQLDPPLGDYLGELTNELKPDDYIVEFVSGGPKNYAYTTAKGEQTCKIRGFSLNYMGSQLLNFESVRDIVGQVNPSKPLTYKKRGLEDGDEPPSKIIVVTNPSKISRDKYNNVLYNRTENKQYRVVYDKRVILENYDTLPYGY
ncbi:hypothetical protein ACF0H5_020209 [Mactra antiquata]